MTTITGVGVNPRDGTDAAVASPCGSPEPGLAIVPLGVVPLTISRLLSGALGRPRCYPLTPAPRGRDAKSPRRHERLQGDAEQGVDGVADEPGRLRPGPGSRPGAGQHRVRPPVHRSQRTGGV